MLYVLKIGCVRGDLKHFADPGNALLLQAKVSSASGTELLSIKLLLAVAAAWRRGDCTLLTHDVR